MRPRPSRIGDLVWIKTVSAKGELVDTGLFKDFVVEYHDGEDVVDREFKVDDLYLLKTRRERYGTPN